MTLLKSMFYSYLYEKDVAAIPKNKLSWIIKQVLLNISLAELPYKFQESSYIFRETKGFMFL